MWVDALQAQQVIVGGLFYGCCSVLPNVQAEYAAMRAPLAAFHIGDKGVQALVIESHAVDQSLFARQPEHAWTRIAWLAFWGHGAHFNKAKTQVAQGIDIFTVFIQP